MQGTWAPEHLFALGQGLVAWEFYQKLLGECDQRIEVVLRELAGPEPEPPAPQIEQLHQLLRRLCGGRDVTPDDAFRPPSPLGGERAGVRAI